MLTTSKKTIEKTYKFDERGEKIIGETIVETVDDTVPSITSAAVSCEPCEIDTGIELVDDDAASLFEVFLTVAAGALFGGLLYNAIKKG